RHVGNAQVGRPIIDEPSMFDEIPDGRDGLTRKERVVLWVLRQAEVERKGRDVRAAMLYGRAVEHVDMSIEEFMRIVERLSALAHPLLTRSQQSKELRESSVRRKA